MYLIITLASIPQIIEVLETSGYENLITFAHGDAKPNNFMFRNIEIDIEDLVKRRFWYKLLQGSFCKFG
jgi:hypothetical protein